MQKNIVAALIVGAGIGGALVASQWPRLNDGRASNATQKGAPEADWQAMAPAIISLVETAETAAREMAAADLEAWRVGVMAKVDQHFLDDRTSYWNTAIGPLATGATTYWRCLMAGFDCTEANKKATEDAQTDFAVAFAAKVIGPDDAQRDLDAIRRKAEERFITRINDELGRMPPRWGLTPVTFTRELDRVVVLSADVGNGRLEQVGFGTLMAQAAANPQVREALGAALRKGVHTMADCKATLEACAMRGGTAVAGTLAGAAIKSGAPAAGVTAVAKSLGAGKAVSAGIGAVTSMALVPVAIGAFEWWRHGQFVATEKPKLRGEIDKTLRAFIDGALAGDGHIGATMRDIAVQVRERVDRRGRAA